MFVFQYLVTLALDKKCFYHRNIFDVLTDISLDVPDEIDLSFLRGKGIQPNEEELPESPPEGGGESLAQFLLMKCLIFFFFFLFSV